MKHLRRAYPSLNLTLHVSKDQTAVQCVLPGLRFDDIDHSGQPNMATVFDIISHVETAAVGLEPSFLDYMSLRRQDFRHYIKACMMEINSSFYEMTTPKAPLDIRIKLASIGKTSFTTFSELSSGGKMSPSITLENVHCLVHKPTASIHELPEWWKDRFSASLINPAPKLEVTPAIKPSSSFPTSVLIPLSDTDHNERTRCASYLRYFMDNTSVASRRAFYEHIKSTFHEFHIKRLSMYYYQASFWGDTLTTDTWQTDDPLDIHCMITNNSAPVWYGKMELHERVFGLPSLKTNGNNAEKKDN